MIQHFDPNAAANAESGIFGLPTLYEDAALVFLPIPWEATTSYGGGTSEGPKAILKASRQVDLFDFDVVRPYEPGLFCLEESSQIRQWNDEGKAFAAQIIEASGQIGNDPQLHKALARVNELSVRVNEVVREETRKLLRDGKIPGLIGGDHSVPLGAFQAIGEKWGAFGILHFDAHSDTRNAYEGFTYSHASIMRCALERVPQITKLVQVGIRDFCEEEMDYCDSQGNRVQVFHDAAIAHDRFEGRSFSQIAQDIVNELPQEVWVSFDIDGLDPRLCPNTGTPVPGGLDFHEANYILGAVVRSGRKIIGFDLNEVAPDPQGENEWDANVGARLLYKLSAWTLASQGKAKVRELPPRKTGLPR